MGLMKDLKEAFNPKIQQENALREQQRKKDLEQQETALNTKAAGVVLTTTDIRQEYELVAPVMSIGTDDANPGAVWVTEVASKIGIRDYSGRKLQGNPLIAFQNANHFLRRACIAMEGDAVIGVRYEHRVAIGEVSGSTASQAVEIWAYGTAVRLKR